jgi:hypothetical protein
MLVERPAAAKQRLLFIVSRPAAGAGWVSIKLAPAAGRETNLPGSI